MWILLQLGKKLQMKMKSSAQGGDILVVEKGLF